MDIWNNEKIAKALTASTDLAFGGQLNREQQDKFVKLMMEHTTMLSPGSGVRALRKSQQSGNVDKMMLHGPVTMGADQVAGGGLAAAAKASAEDFGSPSTSANLTKMYDQNYEKFQTIKWDATKVVARTAWTTEFLRENIERQSLEGELRNRVLAKMGSDLEDLAINGTGDGDFNNPRGALLSNNVGWDKLSDSAHIYDNAGDYISRATFVNAYKKLPRHLRRTRPNLKWFMNDDIEMDWMDLLAGRMDSVGSAAIGGSVVNPLGIPYMRVPLIPSDKNIKLVVAKAGMIRGVRSGPFKFTQDTNSAIDLTVDAANNFDIDFGDDAAVTALGLTAYSTAGTVYVRTTAEVAAIINTAYSRERGVAYDNIASADPVTDELVITSPTTGAASKVLVTGGTDLEKASADLLGLGLENAAGVYESTNNQAGAAAAAAGQDIATGSFVWLSDPANFMHITVTSDAGANSAGVRSFSEFNKDRDRVEFIVYAWVDALIEDTQSMVKIDNLRVASGAAA